MLMKREPIFDDLLSNDLWPSFDHLFERVTQPSQKIQTMELDRPYAVDLPGVRKEDVEVELDGRRVAISWSRGETKGQYFTYVPEGTEEIKATLDLGVLTLTATGKEPRPTRKKIKIE